MKFLSTKEDVQWLCETHLKKKAPPEFKSFVLHGNEDCPTKIELYASNKPLVTDVPAATYVLNNETEPFYHRVS